VDNEADAASAAYLRVAVEALPWTQLEDDSRAFMRRYLHRSIDVEGSMVLFDEQTIL